MEEVKTTNENLEVKENQEKEIKKLPVVAMRGLTVFPNTSLHFTIGREKSFEALKYALKHDGEILLISQKDAQVEIPETNNLEEIGTLALIKHALPSGPIEMRVLIDGIKRIKVTKYVQEDPFIMAEFEDYDSVEEEGLVIETLKRKAIEYIKQINDINPTANNEVIANLVNENDNKLFIDKTANVFGGKRQQEILNAKEIVKQFDILVEVLAGEVEIAKIDKLISQKVQKGIDENQKEFYLREQLKAISEELGDNTEMDQLEEKIKALPIEDNYKDKLLKDLTRTKKMPAISPEYSILMTYLEFVTELPWDKQSEDTINLVEAEKILNQDHYGLEKIKDRILEFLAVRRLSKERKEPIMCFVGPPGVGKTSIVQSIAKAMNRKYIRMSLGGVRDEAEIRGHRKTYVGAMSGRIMSNLSLCGTSNPVFLLDEIDKLASDYKGDPSSALLEVLDPEQNFSFRDNYLEIPYDLSNVLFITTANSLQTIPPALLDRMEIIEMSGYTPEEKLQIAIRHLIPKQLKANGLEELNVTVTKGAVEKMINDYTAESGVRGLEKQISKLFRKIAKNYVEDLDNGKSTSKISVTAQNLSKYLGTETNRRSELSHKASIGEVTGLAWTSIGGEVLTIEATIFEGKGDIILTGKLGEVMQESAKIAISYLKKNAKKYNIPDLSDKDIHIHVPEGAVPKDGPSAGVTLATAVLSALTGKRVRGDIAMTGEITLNGNVLAIGGLKEKSLAANRNNIYEIILPKENERDLKDLPQMIIKSVNFHFVEKLDEVFDLAFEDKLCK